MKIKIYVSLMILMGIICAIFYKLIDVDQGINWLYPVIPGFLGFVFMLLSMSNQTSK